ALLLDATPRADPHDPDARQTELRRECAVRPAALAQAADLVVAFCLDAARKTAGEDRRFRDADAKSLGDDAERTSLADHLHDLVLGGSGTPHTDAPAGERSLGSGGKRGRITEQSCAQPVGIEAEVVAHVVE